MPGDQLPPEAPALGLRVVHAFLAVSRLADGERLRRRDAAGGAVELGGGRAAVRASGRGGGGRKQEPQCPLPVLQGLRRVSGEGERSAGASACRRSFHGGRGLEISKCAPLTPREGGSFLLRKRASVCALGPGN